MDEPLLGGLCLLLWGLCHVHIHAALELPSSCYNAVKFVLEIMHDQCLIRQPVLHRSLPAMGLLRPRSLCQTQLNALQRWHMMTLTCEVAQHRSVRLLTARPPRALQKLLANRDVRLSHLTPSCETQGQVAWRARHYQRWQISTRSCVTSTCCQKQMRTAPRRLSCLRDMQPPYSMSSSRA